MMYSYINYILDFSVNLQFLLELNFFFFFTLGLMFMFTILFFRWISHLKVRILVIVWQELAVIFLLQK